VPMGAKIALVCNGTDIVTAVTYAPAMTTTTAAPGDNSTLVATTAFVTAAAPASGFTTGDAKLTLKTSPDTGWVMANDKTIGNAASNATNRANADTVDLFTLLYTLADADCPLYTSGGVLTPRATAGVAAVAYAANYAVALPLMLGRAIALSGSGSGLTARVLGHALGEETHQLTTAELASHNHGVTDPGHSHATDSSTGAQPFIQAISGGNSDAAGQAVHTSTTGITIGYSGSGTAHNTMQPTVFLNCMVKL
jgi:microcystin-dependent protein